MNEAEQIVPVPDGDDTYSLAHILNLTSINVDKKTNMTFMVQTRLVANECYSWQCMFGRERERGREREEVRWGRS